MSDPQTPNDPEQPNAPQPEPPAEPPSSPFPESSLARQEPDPPAPPAPAPPQEPPPTPGGFTSGDPLGGSSSPAPPPAFAPPPAATAAPELPTGYTSPPPPGAIGGFTPAAGRPAPGSYRLGSWGARVGAAIIDGLIIFVPSMILLFAIGAGIASSDDGDGSAASIGGFIATFFVILLVWLFYAPVMMSRTNGKTVGRMVTNIRVIRANGKPMSFGWACLREIVVKGILINGIGSATFGLLGLLDVLWPLWDDENRALHDFVVDTRTIQD